MQTLRLDEEVNTHSIKYINWFGREIRFVFAHIFSLKVYFSHYKLYDLTSLQ